MTSVSLLLAVSTLTRLVPYTDAEARFRVLRPAAWQVERVRVNLMETVFYRDHPRRGPRAVVVPQAQVAASTLREAACLMLQYVRPADIVPPRSGPWPRRRCGFPWSFHTAATTSGEGEAAWQAGRARERTLYRIRLIQKSGGVLQVDFLAGVAPADEFISLRPIFRQVIRSYRAP
ncbi:MAG: hypothetical protein QN200_05985 [Armatimonadota bacterium]|nr:hypothetical protein [Armatimonadota bacterium]MDR7444371.1 hypothetical protein [Armatimonadota bacterium]MDR7614858.1 hypothetical protein [Armatimonadota bacterium]